VTEPDQTADSVVITATGVLSPAGVGTKSLFDAMLAGEGFIPTETELGADDPLPWPMATTDPSDAVWPAGSPWDKVHKYANSSAQTAVAVALLALADAGPSPTASAHRCGTVMAVSSSGSDDLGEVMPRIATLAQTDPRPLARLLYDEVPDYAYIRGIPSQLGQFVAMANGFRGSNVAVYGEVGANGLGALALAERLIRSGELDRVMVVGVAPQLSVASLVGLDREARLARDAAPGRGPFDRDRAGTLLGQGAAALVLERDSTAAGRQATPLARLHRCAVMAAKDQSQALRAAVSSALRNSRPPGLWWAQANGSVESDGQEWRAVRNYVRAPTTSSRGTIGTAFESAALIDVALGVEAIGRRLAPPIGLLRQLAPDLADLDAIQGTPRPLDGSESVLITSLNHGRSASAAGAIVLEPIEARGGQR
jgi:3-oxoacyl-[acyl-carrier-protein] synthase II